MGKVTCEIDVDDEDVGADGKIRGAIGLPGVPRFVVPLVFRAAFDDPNCPAVVTLTVEVRPGRALVLEVVQSARINTEILFIPDFSPWSPVYHPLGELPAVRVPSLRRVALAHAAMPESRPYRDQFGQHSADVLRALPNRRSQRVSEYELALIRHYSDEALADSSLSTKFEQREYVFDCMNAELPERWPRTDGQLPDYDRLRPFLAALEAEISANELPGSEVAPP